MDFKVKPFQHQLDILERAKTQPHLALLWEAGTGKTFGMINILRWHYNTARKIRKTIIHAPSVVLYNWKEEIKRYSSIDDSLSMISTGTGIRRVNKLKEFMLKNGDEGIIIINYEAMINDSLFVTLRDWKPSIIVADEMHKIKSPSSKAAKSVVSLADDVRKAGGNCYGLTGTLILNSVEDVFMQYRYLDGGKTFGDNFWRFKRQYMYDKNEGWSGPKRFADWRPLPKAAEDINQKIQGISSRVVKKDVLDLPPLIKMQRYAELSINQKQAYKEMRDQLITWIKAEGAAVSAVNMLSRALRLQQIVTGFANDEDDNAIEIPGENPRLAVVKELLMELCLNHKVIIWCCFRYNYRQLSRLCEEIGLKYVCVYGGMDIKEKSVYVDQFQTDPSTKVLIGNRAAAGIGINLTAASYSIVYSRNFSLGEELQSEARNYRAGSEVHEKITKIDIVAKDTIDETVLKALYNKQDLSDKIIDLIKE